MAKMLLALLLFACTVAHEPPAEPTKVLSAACATPALARGDQFELTVRIKSVADAELDVCIEQISARLRGASGEYRRLIYSRTTFDNPCPDRRQVSRDGEALVTLPVVVWNDAPEEDLAIDVLLGMRWPPEMTTTPSNARFELRATCERK